LNYTRADDASVGRTLAASARVGKIGFAPATANATARFQENPGQRQSPVTR